MLSERKDGGEMDTGMMIEGLDTLLGYGKEWMNVVGDCPNIEIRVNADMLFWNNIKIVRGWHLQVNSLTGGARIVSPNVVRKANGSISAMLEKFNRLTASLFFRRGDVIGVSRNGLYEHYGIYVGADRVIHYCGELDDWQGKVTVCETGMEEFLKDSKGCFVVSFLERRPVKIMESTNFIFNSSTDVYEPEFRRKRKVIYSPEETVARAYSRLGEERYNLITNNCEHFAMWCKTGMSESSQVKYILSKLE